MFENTRNKEQVHFMLSVSTTAVGIDDIVEPAQYPQNNKMRSILLDQA